MTVSMVKFASLPHLYPMSARVPCWCSAWLISLMTKKGPGGRDWWFSWCKRVAMTVSSLENDFLILCSSLSCFALVWWKHLNEVISQVWKLLSQKIVKLGHRILFIQHSKWSLKESISWCLYYVLITSDVHIQPRHFTSIELTQSKS